MIIELTGRRGVVANKVLLDKKMLRLEDAQKYTLGENFDWSNISNGSSLLSTAVLLKVSCRTVMQYNKSKFRYEVISNLPKSNFKTKIDMKPYLYCFAGFRFHSRISHTIVLLFNEEFNMYVAERETTKTVVYTEPLLNLNKISEKEIKSLPFKVSQTVLETL